MYVYEVITAISSEHFKNDGVLKPSMEFLRSSEIEFLENKIRVKLRDNGWPKISWKMLKYVPFKQVTMKHYGGKWDSSKKKGNKWNRNSKSALSKIFHMR